MNGRYRLIAFSLAIGFALGQSVIADRIDRATLRTYEAIDLHPLRDGMNHWRKRYGRVSSSRSIPCPKSRWKGARAMRGTALDLREFWNGIIPRGRRV